MITIRKFGYAALVLAAFAGCSQEQPPATPAATPAPPAETTTEVKPAPAPEATPAEKPAPSSEAPKVEAPSPSPKEEAKPEAKDEGKAAAVKLEPEEIAEIKKLPAADAEVALKQMVCPVSGEHLGSMDVPVKVSALGKTFFLCCKSCNKDVKDNPAEVVAKLKQ
jgi:YHS domain-containing protein